ncbi:hypothetical protein M378DRAFT_168603 [Amanita muscaria Koide BX008]|uniref:Uncharacterized protein n=1 Tax=Amanita muscaria (strain Koide BX008) TaxID=946122 RepID=A0A0C2SAY1_AMAMK|nr:hypothetical protein M378DRAFT_168603 [Amanita muscaria Koide BX008]
MDVVWYTKPMRLNCTSDKTLSRRHLDDWKSACQNRDDGNGLFDSVCKKIEMTGIPETVRNGLFDSMGKE